MLPGEARELFPLMTPTASLGAVLLPSDGHLDPSQPAYALAGRGAGRGVQIPAHPRARRRDRYGRP